MAVNADLITQAQIKLYEYLRDLDGFVLDCNTDSAIYNHNVDETPKLKTGEYLSDLTDEVEEFGSGTQSKSLYRVVPKTVHSLFFLINRKTYNEMQSGG